MSTVQNSLSYDLACIVAFSVFVYRKAFPVLIFPLAFFDYDLSNFSSHSRILCLFCHVFLSIKEFLFFSLSSYVANFDIPV